MMALEEKPDVTKVISVIIPCFGHFVELESCLCALNSQEGDVPFEVIVVESASDHRVEEVTRQFPFVRLVRSNVRLFPGAARNLGVRHAKGPGLAFIDADCIPAPNWIQRASESIRSNAKITGGPILDVMPVHPVAWVDNRLQFADFRTGRPSGNLLHVPSCNMVMARTFFEESGGFDEDMAIGEDVMFTAQANKSFSGVIRFRPDLIVRHQGRRSWRGFIEHQRAFGFHRASLGLFMKGSLAWLARHRIFAGIVVVRRLGYIMLRTFQYDRVGLVRLTLLSPLVLAGLIAWTKGFYLGMKERKT